MPINSNQINGKVVTIDTANVTYNLADFSTPNTSAEPVTGVTITSIYWSTNDSITVLRGANTLCVLHTSGFWDLAGGGNSLLKDKAGSIVIQIPTSGTIVLELSKDTNFISAY